VYLALSERDQSNAEHPAIANLDEWHFPAHAQVLNARAALSTSGALPENVNYAVQSSFLLGFLESVPEVSAKLKQPNAKEVKFEDAVKSAEQAAVLVLVY